MSKGDKKKDGDILDLDFDEALARFAQTDPKELEELFEKIRRQEREVEQYVEERRESIRSGARRSKKRFRL